MILRTSTASFSYIEFLLIHFFAGTQFSTSFLSLRAVIVILVFLLDYFMQVWGVKKFGGGRKAYYRNFFRLFMGFFFSTLNRLIIRSFCGAFIGALLEVRGDNNRALKVAVGSFIGFEHMNNFKIGY